MIDESEVGLYHVWSRCVRQEMLFAFDPLTGRDNSHRRDWIIERMEFLCGSYAIEACSFAILSNHYHLLFRNRPDLLERWSDEEVVCRWWRLNPYRYGGKAGDAPTNDQIDRLLGIDGWADEHRRRLGSPSWYMQYLNQNIARRANVESGKSGHFFDRRFGARKLEDLLESLTCSVYVDLNELRAGVASCLEDSNYSSVVRRIARLRKGEEALLAGDIEAAAWYAPNDPDYWMCPVDEDERAPALGELWLPPGCDTGASQPRTPDTAADAACVAAEIATDVAPVDAAAVEPELGGAAASDELTSVRESDKPSVDSASSGADSAPVDSASSGADSSDADSSGEPESVCEGASSGVGEDGHHVGEAGDRDDEVGMANPGTSIRGPASGPASGPGAVELAGSDGGRGDAGAVGGGARRPERSPGRFDREPPLRHGFLPVSLGSYLQLVDLEGRRESPGRGSMDPELPPLLERLGITVDTWLRAFEGTMRWFADQLGDSHLANPDPGDSEIESGFS